MDAGGSKWKMATKMHVTALRKACITHHSAQGMHTPGRACHGAADWVHEWHCAGSRRSGRTNLGLQDAGSYASQWGSAPGCTQ
eukprot:9043344-Alexandrium_andersonii.AAC.1